ncbi:MAG: hypothetical protein IKC11_01940 [Clostridia bacterium]|nr:hypothetical protein [Clostridia bacterium]
MIKLNLEVKTNEEKRIKEYLEENVSETLADKINNGVHIIKNDKELINKKDLSGFMNYASAEARKLVNNNVRCACIEDTTVFGWAIHYFEEDSIEGKLYNLDGTENKPEIKSKPIEKPKEVKPIIKQNPQQNMFDLMLKMESEEKEEIIINEELKIDQKTGLVETTKDLKESFDEQITILLCSVFGDKLEVK